MSSPSGHSIWLFDSRRDILDQVVHRRLLGIVLSCLAPVSAAVPDSWVLARSSSFEVYSQSGPAPARVAIEWLEQLHSFFRTLTGLSGEVHSPVRVIGFASRKAYDTYRLAPLADAYYVGTNSRDYIVLPSLAPDQFRAAAHEYAHAVIRAAGFHPPRWLDDGFAEVVSTVRFTDAGTLLGSEDPTHRQTLRTAAPSAFRDLLAGTQPASSDRRGAALFYAEAWAFTHMLMFSPEYAGRFPRLASALQSGAASEAALSGVYGKSLDAIARDVQAWVDRSSFAPRRLPAVPRPSPAISVSPVSPFESQMMLADLLAASGALERAESLCRELSVEAPNSAPLMAARGVLALRLGQTNQALRYFQRSVELGIRDASVCYRFAQLADAVGLAGSVVRPALERAVELDPRFDDAHYRLALLDANEGHYEPALAHLSAMQVVRPDRAHAYWSTKANALIELDRREEALAASRKAAQYASSREERIHADQLAYLAQTDLAVQFTRDGNGNPQLATTRVPHDSVERNPFVEPSDQIRKVQARLAGVECGGNRLSIVIETAAATLKLAIPDPSRVEMRNAPAEFTCGAQPLSAVTVVYAAAEAGAGIDGVVRGMVF